MRERFEQQMEILHTELIELGALCEQAIGRTYVVIKKSVAHSIKLQTRTLYKTI